MKFRCTVEDIELEIRIYRDDDYKAHNPLVNFSIQDLEDMKDGLVKTYSLHVVSTKNGQSMEHYSSGVLLSSNEDEIQEELEEILDDFGVVDHILKHWKLNDSNNLSPDWAR
jgi:hypothetical protein